MNGDKQEAQKEIKKLQGNVKYLADHVDSLLRLEKKEPRK